MVAMLATPGQDDSAGLALYDDEAGGERVSLRAQDGACTLTFHPAKGRIEQTLGLGVAKDGSMGLQLEENGRTKIDLGDGPKGEAVRVQTKEGKPLFVVPKP